MRGIEIVIQALFNKSPILHQGLNHSKPFTAFLPGWIYMIGIMGRSDDAQAHAVRKQDRSRLSVKYPGSERSEFICGR